MKKLHLVLPTVLLSAFGGISTANASTPYDAGYCREYTRTIYVGGKPQEGYGTACQQVDGSWRITSGDNVGQTISPQYIVEQPVVYVQEPARPFHHTRYYQPRPSYSSLNISIGSNHGHSWRGRSYHNNKHNWQGRGYGRGHGHGYKHSRVRRSGNTLSWR